MDAQDCKTSLLLVEDEVDTAVLMRYVLETKGFAVHRVGTGEAAIGYLQNGGNADVVLLDLALPDMNGMDVLRVIRNAPQLTQLPVVMLTANHESASMIRASMLGISAYFTKPLSPTGLPDRLRRVLNAQTALPAAVAKADGPHNN
ncbi:MAG: response regulator [Nitrospiraceae bacterium]